MLCGFCDLYSLGNTVRKINTVCRGVRGKEEGAGNVSKMLENRLLLQSAQHSNLKTWNPETNGCNLLIFTTSTEIPVIHFSNVH